MKAPKTKDEVILHKKKAVKSVNNLLEFYINSGSDDLLKKADLIAYWLESFSQYISFEDKFDPARIIKYSRGDVIRLNFGFNVGGELGGLHFAAVLDNDNKHNADVITVIPLSSTDGKTVHPRSVDLGAELFQKIKAKQDALVLNAETELAQIKKIKELLDSAVAHEEQEQEFENAYEDIMKRIKELDNTLLCLKRNGSEILRLKLGSMAVTNQITTVSKQRIYTPKKSEDFLYGVSLSAPALEKINAKICELYLR